MTKVKICGITNKEDAFWASSLGADFIGINFVEESPRKVSTTTAKEIIESLPKYVSAVGVFMNKDVKEISKVVKKVGFGYVQLHGDETKEYCMEIKKIFPQIKIIKVIKIKPDKNFLQEYLDYIKEFVTVVEFFLFDTYVESVAGGSGEVFDWSVVCEIKTLLEQENLKIDFFVAGGLNSENVTDVVEKLEPYGVDVASGVERLPRRKDFEKMKSFIRSAKSV